MRNKSLKQLAIISLSVIVSVAAALCLCLEPAYAQTEYEMNPDLKVIVDDNELQVRINTRNIYSDGDPSFSMNGYSLEPGKKAPWADDLNIDTIHIGEGVWSIGDCCFAEMKNARTVFIPQSIQWIEEDAFRNCDSITRIRYGGTEDQWKQLMDSMKTSDGSSMTGNEVLTTAEISYDFGYSSLNDAGSSKISDKVYTGNMQKPTPSIYFGSGMNRLKKNSDYYIIYDKGGKDVGKAGVTIYGINGYKNSLKVSYRIIPKGTSIKNMSSAKGSLTVRWNKQSEKMSKTRITGYKIQIAADKSFTKGKKTYTVKGYSKTMKKIGSLIKGKRYYVRIRTYKTVGNTTYYSKWSSYKYMKVR